MTRDFTESWQSLRLEDEALEEPRDLDHCERCKGELPEDCYGLCPGCRAEVEEQECPDCTIGYGFGGQGGGYKPEENAFQCGDGSGPGVYEIKCKRHSS